MDFAVCVEVPLNLCSNTNILVLFLVNLDGCCAMEIVDLLTIACFWSSFTLVQNISSGMIKVFLQLALY